MYGTWLTPDNSYIIKINTNNTVSKIYPTINTPTKIQFGKTVNGEYIKQPGIVNYFVAGEPSVSYTYNPISDILVYNTITMKRE